jgi:hypothetical protein
VAAHGNHVEILQNLCVRAEEVQLCLNELKNKLLVVKDKYGYITWHQVARIGSFEALEELWSWAKEAELNCMNCC